MIWWIRCVSDPLVHHGQHFGWTVHALCSVYALLANGLLRDGEWSDEPEDSFTAEYVIFHLSLIALLDTCYILQGKM